MRHMIPLGLALAGVWLLWSGHYTPLLMSFGAGSVLIVVAIARRMNIADHEAAPIELPLRVIAYYPWLFWEIAKANVDVARQILSPGLPIQPHLIKVRAGQKRDVGRAIYANSITLTPGTVSIDIEGDVITVHALTRAAADGVLTGEMDRRCSRLEGGA